MLLTYSDRLALVEGPIARGVSIAVTCRFPIPVSLSCLLPSSRRSFALSACHVDILDPDWSCTYRDTSFSPFERLVYALQAGCL